MANCGGRAMFTLNYDHSEMRTPMSLMPDPHHLGPAKPSLSIDALEFVPSFKPTQMASNVGPNLNHHAYQQQPQQYVIHPQQQQPFQQTPQQQLLNHPQHPHQPFHQLAQHQPQPILNPSFQMHNAYPNQRRGGGRHSSVQDRLNPNADQQFHQNQHHHSQQHHHSGHHHQQQNHSHQHQQNLLNLQQLQLQHSSNQGHNNHHQSSIGKHQMHHVHKVEQQQQLHQQQQQQHSNHMRRNNAGANAHQQNVAAVDPSEDALPTEAEGGALNFLVEVIAKLNEDPGMFENCQKELNAIYIEFSQNTYVISNAIEIIFDQSICEQNFRYMGAKICRLLDAIDASPNSQFRSLLRMKMAFSQEENRQFMTNEAHKVRGTTLFLAELFLQLQNDGSRIADIAHNILQSIDLLLHKTTPENIKCVCFALKLCGYDLELDCHNEVGGILNALKQMTDTDVSTQRLIKSVLDLASNRWGRNETTLALSTPVIEQSQQVFTNDPVFYGPDGKIITEEESSFLSSILAAANQCDDSEKDDLESDPEMDDEMQVAYKDFLQAMPK